MRELMKEGPVGIWHETYLVEPGKFECVYGNMPRFGLAAAGDHVKLEGRLAAAAADRRGVMHSMFAMLDVGCRSFNPGMQDVSAPPRDVSARRGAENYDEGKHLNRLAFVAITFLLIHATPANSFVPLPD